MRNRRARARSSCALLRASRARAPGALNTTQWNSSSRWSARSCSIVPPQPISISSACAPRQSTLVARPLVVLSVRGSIDEPPRLDGRGSGVSRRCGSRGVLAPDFPRRDAPRIEIVNALLVLRRIHRHEEAVVLVRKQLAVADQLLKRLLDQLMPVVQIPKNVLLENEETAVDPQPRLADVVKAGHEPVIRRRREVI